MGSIPPCCCCSHLFPLSSRWPRFLALAGRYTVSFSDPRAKAHFPLSFMTTVPTRIRPRRSKFSARVFAARRWILFAPYRRRQGLSAAEGPVIEDEIAAARRTGGLPAAAATMIQLPGTDHLNDQLAALAWLKTQDFVAPDRIAVRVIRSAGWRACWAPSEGATVPPWTLLRRGKLDAVPRVAGSYNSRCAKLAPPPGFLFRAANDYDLSPSRELSAAMRNARKPMR